MPSTISGAKVVTDEIEDSSGNNPYSWTLGAKVLTTSGTTIEADGIPVGTKKVDVLFRTVSTNGTGEWEVQLGTSGGFQTTGYTSTSSNGDNADESTTSLKLTYGVSAVTTRSGILSLRLQEDSTNAWVSTALLNKSTGASLLCYHAGCVALSGDLFKIKVFNTAVNTWDNGSISLLFQ